MKKIKLSKTWIIVIVIVLVIIGYYIGKEIFKSPTEGLIIEVIDRGTVVQEVSETGMVKATEEISMGFKSIGKISKIYVAVGNNVKKGDILAELDLSQTSAQLQSAEAALNSAKTQYDKLINGLPLEDIKIYEDAVTSARKDLQGAYDNSLNVLNDAYDKVYKTYDVADYILDTYFYLADQQGIAVSDGSKDMNINMQNIKKYLDSLTVGSLNGEIDSVIANTISALSNVYSDLKIIREQCDQASYYSSVSSADKTSLDTQKTYVNAASTSVTTLQNSIITYKTALQRAENNLSSATATARPEDVEIYKAQIEQAQANVRAIQSQSNDNYLVSSIDGLITEVDVKRGQVVSPSQSIIKMLSTEPFQIKVNIYEKDIVNVKVGDSVKVNLVAFPKQTFIGDVSFINPAETIIDNVVYYEVTIDFPKQPEGIRSGMTADISIETYKKDNVIRISKNSVTNINNVETVQVIRGRKIMDVVITTALEGDDYFEVLSGLSEGDQIVVGNK